MNRFLKESDILKWIISVWLGGSVLNGIEVEYNFIRIRNA